MWMEAILRKFIFILILCQLVGCVDTPTEEGTSDSGTTTTIVDSTKIGADAVYAKNAIDSRGSSSRKFFFLGFVRRRKARESSYASEDETIGGASPLTWYLYREQPSAVGFPSSW